MVLFVQSYSLGDVGGGAKILRSVYDYAPVNVASVCTGFRKQIPKWSGKEYHIPIRPWLGRIEITRFHWIGSYLETIWGPYFRNRFKKFLLSSNPQAVHIVPHGTGDFAFVHQICRDLNIPIHTSIHDDFRYSARNHPHLKKLDGKLGSLWRDASTRFVISEEMGLEYSSRYGKRSFIIHTDGINPSPFFQWKPTGNPLRMYFMGMFHNDYTTNIQAILEAYAAKFAPSAKDLGFKFSLRTSGLKIDQLIGKEFVHLLPFAPPEIIRTEMQEQDFLYLPLPFSEEAANFTKFSLSTKMISYLASGVPIIYHGPEWSAAGQYLRRNNSAIQINSNDPNLIAEALDQTLSNPDHLRLISENAQTAAKRDFDSETLRQRFWTSLLQE
jgi:glycosyltransferase involved in cell wall biosynthesis